MKQLTILAVCAATCFLWSATPVAGQAPTAASARADREGIDAARKRIYPALVNISVVNRDFSGGRTVRVPSAGSGTIIDPQGRVVTNYHVVVGGTRIVCTLTTGEQIPAEIVGLDAETDLAVLQLKLDRRPKDAPPLVWAQLAKNDDLQVGDRVLAVGNPLSLSSSMTLGIVSNTKRVFADRNGQMAPLQMPDGAASGMFTQWIQTDALILPGNSGGPLVNLRGEIVGVNTRGGQGVGFASPAPLVRTVVGEILREGRVQRGWTGMSILPAGLLDRSAGALVSSVLPDSAAAKAGIKPGDILLSIAGKKVDCRFGEQVPLVYGRLAALTPGARVEVVILREEKPLSLSMTIDEREPSIGETREIRVQGITVTEITGPMARGARLDDKSGVVVSGIRSGFPFEEAKPSISLGDIIREFDGRPIANLDDFEAAVAASLKKDEVAVRYRRGRSEWITVVKTKDDPRPKPGGELAKPWLGISTQVLTPKIAKALEAGDKKGFRITQVYPDTMAAKAGLKTGDILWAVEGEALTASRTQDGKDLRNLIEDRYSIAEEIALSVLREGKEQEITVELEESPASSSETRTAEARLLEFAVRDLTFFDRINRRLKRDALGVLVTSAESGGWASLAGLGPGDIIQKLDGVAVKNTRQFETLMADIEKRQPERLALFLRRGFSTTFVIIEPDWSESRTRQK